jgi:hypothetical protein
MLLAKSSLDTAEKKLKLTFASSKGRMDEFVFTESGRHKVTILML